MTRRVTINLADFADTEVAGMRVTVDPVRTTAVAEGDGRPARHIITSAQTKTTNSSGTVTFDLIPSDDRLGISRFYRVSWAGFEAEFLMPNRNDTLFEILRTQDQIHQTTPPSAIYATSNDLDDEIAARRQGDTDEARDRIAADQQLQQNIDSLIPRGGFARRDDLLLEINNRIAGDNAAGRRLDLIEADDWVTGRRLGQHVVHGGGAGHIASRTITAYNMAPNTLGEATLDAEVVAKLNDRGDVSAAQLEAEADARLAGDVALGQRIDGLVIPPAFSLSRSQVIGLLQFDVVPGVVVGYTTDGQVADWLTDWRVWVSGGDTVGDVWMSMSIEGLSTLAAPAPSAPGASLARHKLSATNVYNYTFADANRTTLLDGRAVRRQGRDIEIDLNFYDADRGGNVIDVVTLAVDWLPAPSAPAPRASHTLVAPWDTSIAGGERAEASRVTSFVLPANYTDWRHLSFKPLVGSLVFQASTISTAWLAVITRDEAVALDYGSVSAISVLWTRATRIVNVPRGGGVTDFAYAELHD